MARDRLSPSRVRATAFRKTKATRNSSPEHSDAVPSGIGEKFETLESINSSTSTNHFRHDQCTPATNLDSLLLTSTALRTTLEGFVETLQLAGLSGPVTLIGKPQLIERGGQFAVYKREALFLGRDGFVHPLVAIKQPLFPLVDNQPTELANKSVQRNLKHVSNEIKALTNERLRYHPNIVELLSWAWEEDYNHPLVLVLELAHEDLEKALKSNDPPGFFLRVRFCNDVANGLDAIHEAKFVHGDLKPANVLIFFEAFRPVAKLADFGYSMEEGQGCNTGTAGWQAPEKEASIDADCFTFGLLVWSTLLLNGQIPTRRAELSWKDTAVTDLENRRSDISQEVFERILQSMTSVLAVDPGLRTRRLTTFFASTTELKANDDERTDVTHHDPHSAYNFAASRFRWEVEPLHGNLLKSLYRRFVESDGAPQSITPDRLLAVALRFSHEPPLGLHDISSALRDILQISAKRGNVAACALASRYSLRLKPPHNTGEITKWLQTAIKTGSLIARDDLYQIDTEATGDAVRCFINRGGLNQAYWDLERIPLQPSPITATSVDRLHWLSAFGTVEDLKTYLSRTSGTYVNAISERRETALYLACVRGSWGHVEVLLDYRADPAIKCTASEFTCLHWAIGFDTAVCKTVVQELIKAGAEVNALVSLQDTPFPHYPFVLPAGTPLHWAVATSRHVTIKALIDAGANALQRNNSDPYMYDDRVRWLYAIGGPNSEGCTFPEADCLGLSSLDIAAIYRDPFLFQTHVDKSAHIDMDSADEEGFTVLHRLATNQTFRTSRRITYSPRPFRNATDAKVLRAIVKAVLILGGNIEILTSSAETTKRKEQRPTDLDKASYTPLMLAMLEGDKDLVETLLDCGASVHTENLVGETALFHTSHRANAAQPDLIRCVRKLISRGADVNHHSSNGNCALLSAAQSRLIPVFDFLLSKDASIDERDCMEHTLTPGKSVFASFASNRDGSDEEVLELLKTHVLNARNAAKKGRVVQGSADNGQTLLHEFVAFAMPQCAELVLQHGARVNALHRRTTFMKDNQPNEGKKIWYETPWDAIAVSKSYFDDSMSAQVTRSLQQLTNVQARWEECEELLKSHGGVACQECEHYEAWP